MSATIRCGDGEMCTETVTASTGVPEIVAVLLARLNQGDSWAEARIDDNPIAQIRVERITETKGGAE